MNPYLLTSRGFQGGGAPLVENFLRQFRRHPAGLQLD